MKQARLVASVLAAGVLAAGSIFGATPRGIAQQSDMSDLSAADQAANYPASLEVAIERDLATDPITYASNSLAAADASATADALRDQLADNFGGAWFDPAAGRLNVAVTSQGAADMVRQRGAEAHIRGVNEERLIEVSADLRAWIDGLPAERRALIYGLSTSAKTSSVTLAFSATSAGRSLAAELPGDHGVELNTEFVLEPPQTQQAADLLGGQGISAAAEDGSELASCSLGFNAIDGQGRALALTSGHCATDAATILAADGTEIGVPERVAWNSIADGDDGDDYASVRVQNPNLIAQPAVTDWQGGTLPVEGVVAPIEGMQVCHSGQTSQWECGQIQQVDVEVRVNGPDGTVKSQRSFWYDACTERGDSGGAVLAGTLAVGLHSAGALTPDDRRCLSTIGEQNIAFAEPLATDVIGDFGDDLRVLTTTADTDGDGVPDHEELAADRTTVHDANGDGVPAFLDPDEPTLGVPVVTSPEDGSRHTERSLPIVGTSKPGATVTVTYRGQSHLVTADDRGEWRLPAEEQLALGHYEITVSQSWTATNGSQWQSGETTSGFFIAPGPPAITSPQDGAEIDETAPMIFGTGEPGAVVELTVDDVDLGTASVVDDNGEWSITLVEPLSHGSHTIAAVQLVEDVGSNPTSITITVLPSEGGHTTVIPEAPGGPGANPPTGGDPDLADTGVSVALLALLGTAGLVAGTLLMLRRRREQLGVAGQTEAD
ncbi:S1 family peptidase [Actinoalloteichus hymeniacidonis]|uniref:Trypsin n=1 Tax=Actinoalloteichus hymeniacidonis TaxID=340345 RepID=A0AAC9HL65_9PSEU|nr:S1 family peptidase [Actinoalloteichus hymeniacidonis]AOS61194.1 Trypsin [Actinoalloteichus hymeniacidonis]MBB5910805.1 LPXTG-motif cell wall-anchored protein [Actinoalloteichus hymeniacidonis]